MSLVSFDRAMDEGASASAGRGRIAADIALVVLLIATVVAISAHGPSHTYAYAQLWQIGAAIDMLENGRWLLPRNQQGEIFRKPPLYAWLEAPILKLTGTYNDFVFRLPTVAASLVMGVMVYFLGRRWYGRRVGLLAACLWATIMHMSKLMYLALTDMLLTTCITAAIMCADRLVFHPCPRHRRRRWAVGFWAAMILAALAKGWGLINLGVVGGLIAIAAALSPPFKALKAVRWPSRMPLAVRLVLRGWWRAIRAIRLGWGMAAFLAVLVPVLIGMFLQGGEEFRRIVHFEIWQRVTGTGRSPPRPGSMPTVVYLLYYALPVSVFAVGALPGVRLRSLLSRRSPLFLPLCWVAAVVVPFSLMHGFRPDYLLPCYAALALMGAWGIEAAARHARDEGAVGRALRRLYAAVPVLIGAGLVLLPPVYFFHAHMPAFIVKNIKMPARVTQETWWMLGGVVGLGLVAVILGDAAGRRRRPRRSAAVAIVAMLGVMFVDTHMISPRAARTGDGEKMRAFADEVRRIAGSDQVCFYAADRLCVQLYLGRLGRRVPTFNPKRKESAAEGAQRVIAALSASGAPWLVTSGRGLVRLGAAKADDKGEYSIARGNGKLRVTILPEELGDEWYASSEPVKYQAWGRIYLIRLKKDIRPSGVPTIVGHVSGVPE